MKNLVNLSIKRGITAVNSTIGVRDGFCSGGGGGGAEVSCPNIHCLHENEVVVPEFYQIFCPRMGI